MSPFSATEFPFPPNIQPPPLGERFLLLLKFCIVKETSSYSFNHYKKVISIKTTW